MQNKTKSSFTPFNFHFILFKIMNVGKFHENAASVVPLQAVLNENFTRKNR